MQSGGIIQQYSGPKDSRGPEDVKITNKRSPSVARGSVICSYAKEVEC